VEEDRYPYAISLQDSNGHFCGGTLILKDVVLTAAHCSITADDDGDGGGSIIDVLINRHDFDDKDGEIISVKTQIQHPYYNEDTSENDLALLILDRPVQKVVVPLVKLNAGNSYPVTGTTAHVIGWGNLSTDGFQLPDVPYEVNVDVISNADCEEMKQDGESYRAYGYEISNDMICTYTDRKDACQGDSGGPLIIKGNDASQDVQIGIVSWGVGCAFLPGVYSRVSYGYRWIKEEACKRSVDASGSTLCGTHQPTKEPTPNPTPKPSNQPSSQPTQTPTSEPSESPSLSSHPSEVPSHFPSLSPSTVPSLSSIPSFSPTFSDAPTQSSAPTEVRNIRFDPGNSLVINSVELVNGDGNTDSSDTSSAFGSGADVGSLTVFVITSWLYYHY
jgi:trypsin